ncbi:hypothetical protein SCOCK_160200 [Actinacidiphila cocklensis]|uniref:Uncharacterized protein n=1 Tax=Actinacidiphila cocklensis TaxID=887465 RepID=A0A9W4DMN2_9ACTN|nr:hypothetical protein SCOCK_160200 [Actinacidiphila cocklensis]
MPLAERASSTAASWLVAQFRPQSFAWGTPSAAWSDCPSRWRCILPASPAGRSVLQQSFAWGYPHAPLKNAHPLRRGQPCQEQTLRAGGRRPKGALGVPPGETRGAELRAQPNAGGKPTAHRKGPPPGGGGASGGTQDRGGGTCVREVPRRGDGGTPRNPRNLAGGAALA